MKLPETITTTLYIVKCSLTGCIYVTTSDLQHQGYLLMGTQEVTLDVPQDFDEEAAKEAVREARAAKLKSDYEKSLANL